MDKYDIGMAFWICVLLALIGIMSASLWVDIPVATFIMEVIYG